MRKVTIKICIQFTILQKNPQRLGTFWVLYQKYSKYIIRILIFSIVSKIIVSYRFKNKYISWIEYLLLIVNQNLPKNLAFNDFIWMICFIFKIFHLNLSVFFYSLEYLFRITCVHPTAIKLTYYCFLPKNKDLLREIQLHLIMAWDNLFRVTFSKTIVTHRVCYLIRCSIFVRKLIIII